jgi:protein-disulfide isomerase
MSNRRRVYLLAGVLLVALVVVVVAILVGGGSKTAKNDSGPTQTTVSSAFLDGVPQSGQTLGQSGAPTLYVFEDPQCPYCRDWSVGTLPDAVAKFVKTGKVKLVWQGIPIIGQNSIDGLQAAYAAGNQNRLWQFIDQLYKRQGPENSGWITESVLRETAGASGVDADKMLNDRKATAKEIAAAERLATRFRLQGTPTFVLVKAPGHQPQTLALTGLDSGAFNSALTQALAS